MDAEALQLLREIRDLHRAGLDELRALRGTLAPHIRKRTLCNGDRDALERLLPAIAEAVGTLTFSTHELIEHAKLEIKANVALREALASIGDNPRKLGRLLSRGTDIDVAGFRIAESGSSRDGVLRTVITITRKN